MCAINFPSANFCFSYCLKYDLIILLKSFSFPAVKFNLIHKSISHLAATFPSLLYGPYCWQKVYFTFAETRLTPKRIWVDRRQTRAVINHQFLNYVHMCVCDTPN